ncbi:protein of unknown function [Hyphomicrobium sp. MC1]|nr:protein of unknown function [Hyphomicrobium sp. MC1]
MDEALSLFDLAMDARQTSAWQRNTSTCVSGPIDVVQAWCSLKTAQPKILLDVWAEC